MADLSKFSAEEIASWAHLKPGDACPHCDHDIVREDCIKGKDLTPRCGRVFRCGCCRKLVQEVGTHFDSCIHDNLVARLD